MGGTTYRQVTEELSPGEWPYQGSTAMYSPIGEAVNQEESPSTCGDAGEVVQELLARRAKTSGSAGARTLAGQLLQKGLIDRFQISILPVLLGEGFPFSKGIFHNPLSLAETKAENGIVELTHLRRGMLL